MHPPSNTQCQDDYVPYAHDLLALHVTTWNSSTYSNDLQMKGKDMLTITNKTSRKPRHAGRRESWAMAQHHINKGTVRNAAHAVPTHAGAPCTMHQALSTLQRKLAGRGVNGKHGINRVALALVA